jgi:hypothetical protein
MSQQPKDQPGAASRVARALAAARALRAGGRTEAQEALSLAIDRLIADAARGSGPEESRPPDRNHTGRRPVVQVVHRHGAVRN